MRIKPFRAIYPNMKMISSPETFFGTVKYDYPSYVKSGFFSQRKKAAFYIYQIKTKYNIHKGIIAAVDIKDISEGKVKKHENTLAYKEQRMTHLLLEREAMVKPILLGYPPDHFVIKEFIEDIINSKQSYFDIDFKEEEENHTFWEIIKPKKIKRLKKIFKNHVPHAYIADGHHRCATTANLYQSNLIEVEEGNKSILASFFSFDELKIHDFNRVIDLFHDVDPTLFGIMLSKYCNIKHINKAKKPSKKHCFHMCIKGKWYQLKWKKSLLKKYKKQCAILDVSLFNHYVLEKILKVPDVREDQRINYVEGTLGQKGIEELVMSDHNMVGFSFFPLSAKEIMDVSDANRILPPKSSYFEPRIKNGLIVKHF